MLMIKRVVHGHYAKHAETPTAPGPGCMVLANDWPKTLKNHCERCNIDTVGEERMGIAICSTTS